MKMNYCFDCTMDVPEGRNGVILALVSYPMGKPYEKKEVMRYETDLQDVEEIELEAWNKARQARVKVNWLNICDSEHPRGWFSANL